MKSTLQTITHDELVTATGGLRIPGPDYPPGGPGPTFPRPFPLPNPSPFPKPGPDPIPYPNPIASR